MTNSTNNPTDFRADYDPTSLPNCITVHFDVQIPPEKTITANGTGSSYISGSTNSNPNIVTYVLSAASSPTSTTHHIDNSIDYGQTISGRPYMEIKIYESEDKKRKDEPLGTSIVIQASESEDRKDIDPS